MANEGLKQRLAAILSADVKGYSRLLSQDRVSTINTLNDHREMFANFVQQYDGRVVDSPGDNILIVLESVSDAVNCAVEIQREIAERNAEVPSARMMQWRIGVNLGDLVEEDGKVYGDGVNIAARLENLAEPGGICISGRVHGQVHGKLGLEYEPLGEHTVKNIDGPIRVYRVLSYPGAAAHRVVKAKGDLVRRWRKTAMVAAAILIAGLGGLAIWHYTSQSDTEPIQATKSDTALEPAQKKPAIAVLPFVNMSDDPKQEYFSDGISEDLITDLSGVSGLLVTSRTTTFAFKGTSLKHGEIAEELGVQYLLEGSVRKVGNDVRINAQLIDTNTGHHLWADRYDGKYEDVLRLQDRISARIVASLKVALTQTDRDRLAKRETDNIHAYDAVLRASDLMRRYIPENVEKALQLCKRAIELDPNYARAYGILSLIYHQTSLPIQIDLSFEERHLQGREYLGKAMLNPTSDAYRVAVWHLHRPERDFDGAIQAAEMAVALEPNFFENYFLVAFAHIWNGQPEIAFDYIATAERIDPACVF